MTDLTELHRALRKRKRPTPVLPRRTAWPMFVPFAFEAEIGRLSKAELMDIVWDLAIRCAGSDTPDTVMEEFRNTREIILELRKPVVKDVA